MSGRFMPVAGEESAVRDSFHRLANACEDAETLAQSRRWLESLLSGCSAATAQAVDWGNLPAAVVPTVATTPKADIADPRLLAFHAPLGLLEGAWLQFLCLAFNHQQAAVASLFAAYRALLGKDEADSPAFAYRGRLQTCPISLPPVTDWQFAHDPRIGAPALDFARVQLALGCHAAWFWPEVLGFTLAYAVSPSPWRLPAFGEPRRSGLLVAIAKHAQAALAALSPESKEHDKVKLGFSLYQQQEHRYLTALARFAASSPSLADQVADIFRRKCPFATGYHQRLTLGGHRLDAWFAAEPFADSAFLAAFAASPYAQGSKGQRLFDRLTDFGGPMFGVFDREELDIIHAWLDGGQAQANPPASASDKAFTSTASEGGAWVAQAGRHSSRPAFPPSLRRVNRRQLYHQLLQADPSEETREMARQWVDHGLKTARTRLLIDRWTTAPVAVYSPQALADWLLATHQRETAKHQARQTRPKLSRPQYVWLIRQFAPAVLADGCWLQHCGQASQQDRRIPRLLYQIYAEELGESCLDWNHPKIYRDLLNELGIDLPAIETPAFAFHPSFVDAAFDLPAYLLAISLFPATYLPELLGLNLAIELSGLGGGYRRLAKDLQHWGINPLMVSLHLSIDNLATGHAAMAAESVQCYLGEVYAAGGAAAQQSHWRRVWAGYRSLLTVSRRFQIRLLPGLAQHWLRDRRTSRPA